MATIRAPSPSFLSAFLPVVRARLFPQEQSLRRIPLLQQIQQLRLRASLLPAALIPIPTLLGELWDGILNAVPKKKTSHMKKRHRQMAGKALKDVTALNKCSGCGRLKRAHVLCPYCVKSIKQWLNNGFKTKEELEVQKEERFERQNEERIARGEKPLKWTDLYDKGKEEEKA
ncbi:hypothetical protein M409DRAFT_59029 [Zasmidium cellare ATCC 36951]|uniref:Large ribosomal subunit protein bL32m n=1 Tax=Zasmidium cellare ATCC 36951 TaxID=1080233 RepID=A0A6A6C894_ZASCE|nr:uncharacterized protein M409DRAFT_59029 [Zasmidium cellare ATCC 36951]KAF2161646.1 hypothetical protein M409DRAFT_59029 [Zasmidium cellare ATCC 36951]